MKRAAVALAGLVSTIAGGIGLEGAFLATGTALVAVGSSYFSAAGPWIVVGAVVLLTGFALALPRRG